MNATQENPGKIGNHRDDHYLQSNDVSNTVWGEILHSWIGRQH